MLAKTKTLRCCSWIGHTALLRILGLTVCLEERGLLGMDLPFQAKFVGIFQDSLATTCQLFSKRVASQKTTTVAKVPDARVVEHNIHKVFESRDLYQLADPKLDKKGKERLDGDDCRGYPGYKPDGSVWNAAQPTRCVHGQWVVIAGGTAAVQGEANAPYTSGHTCDSVKGQSGSGFIDKNGMVFMWLVTKDTVHRNVCILTSMGKHARSLGMNVILDKMLPVCFTKKTSLM